ncbi:hypothetical protein DFQ27_004648 [Actinomortierella ambigua]|uniref:Uncharacterized protein n=1 Tax=Actinomortierella ambigua TaxID=1343610 RepID=A0A9P6U332_9FUNG|nr:hypothetical protein DFQ27_004648 [Actinomortierella ambigua]
MASCVAQTLPHPPRPHYRHRLSSSSGAPSTVRTTLLNVASGSTAAVFGSNDEEEEEEEEEEGEKENDHHQTPNAPLNGRDGLYGGQNGHLTAASPTVSLEGLGACSSSLSSSVSSSSSSSMQRQPLLLPAPTIINADSADRGVTGMTAPTTAQTTTTTTTTTIWSLPPECLSMIVRCVAARGVQDLFTLLCVNRAFFHLVVPALYREPFRVAALLVWKQTGYRGMIERQTKLIRTLLHCCTRAVEKVPPPPCQPLSTTTPKPIAALTPSALLPSASATVSTPPAHMGPQPQPLQQQQQQQPQRQHYGIRRIHPKRTASAPAQYQVQTLAQPQSRRPFFASFLGSVSISSPSSPAAAAAVASSTATSNSILSQSPPAGVASPLPASLHSPSSSPSSSHSPSASSSSSSSSSFSSSTASSSNLQRLATAPLANHSNPHTKRYGLSQILGRGKVTTSTTTTMSTSIPGSKTQPTAASSPSTTPAPPNSISSSPGPPPPPPPPPPSLRPRKRKVEMIPVIWNEEKQQPETAIIPGLEHQRSIPPDLAKTVMELRHDPPPMTNYLAFVTHTDVRSWSAALNLPFVDQILGPKHTWRSKLVRFLKDVPSMATGGVFGNHDAAHANHHGEGWTHFRRRRRRRGGRSKGVWGYHDVDFLELLLVYYTSPRIESLSLGIVCSRNYYTTMEEMPSPRMHERLTRLRRIEIDVEAMSLYATAPQRFIRRHQQMFPGQLREIQIRQSYYYTYDMSKSVLDIIHAMDRIEVLDLSFWMGTFSGFETIRTEHLRKLLINHHIEVTDQHMFDQLLEKCPVLEELSIVVTHPDMFLWAVKRKHDEDKKRIEQITARRQYAADVVGSGGCSRGRGRGEWKATATGWSRGAPSRCGGANRSKGCSNHHHRHSTNNSTTTNTNNNNNNNHRRKNFVLGTRGDLRPRLLPPLKSVVLSGATLDVVSALKHVFFAFRETLESVHVNMHPDASLQLYMHNLDPSFEHLSSSASSSSVPTVSPFNTVDAIPLQAATAAAASISPGAGLPANFPYPIEIYNQQQQQQQQQHLHQHQHLHLQHLHLHQHPHPHVHQQQQQQQQQPLHSQQSSMDDPTASSSSLLPWTPHGPGIHPWGSHSHHHQQQSSGAHGYGHGYESLSASGPSLTPLWALRHRHFLSESRLTPMLGGISMTVGTDRRTRRGRAGASSRGGRRTKAATNPCSEEEEDEEEDDEDDDEDDIDGECEEDEDEDDDDEEEEEEEEEEDDEDAFFPTFEQVACPSPYCLSWSWILPKLRTLSIRGPLATQFSMHLTQFCPRLETVHISSSHGYVVRHQPFL